MKKNKFKFAVTGMFFIVLTLSACRLTDFVGRIFGDDPGSVEDQAAATLDALAPDKDVATPTTASSPTQDMTSTPDKVEATPTGTSVPQGQIGGQLWYPGEFIPPLRIAAIDVSDGENYFMIEVQSGSAYAVDLPPGTYFVLAYLIDPQELGMAPGMAGGYSQAVLCGLQAGCDDHSLVPVVVAPGESVTGIDPKDWYLPIEQKGDWPGDPTQAETGSISGALGFPSEYIPPMRVVAFDVFSQDYQYVDTQLNQTEYQITNLPPSTYQVVAYVREQGPEMAGGYTYFVTCGQTVDCNDHSLIDVNVYGGQETTDVDPIDFYAQPGEADWPENPTQ